METGNEGKERLLTQETISYLYFEEVYPITEPPVANIQQPEEKYEQISVTDETNS